MNFQRVLVPLIGIALVAFGYVKFGWPGVAVVTGGMMMFLLLHFTRAMTVLKRAADRPIGYVDSAVMLNAKLKAGATLMHVMAMTRALKERRRYGGDEGMRRALARTGGAITSCGLIMAGTFATLMLAGLGTLVQVGFALAFGVLLDTFVVRPFLVPAFTVFLWRQQEGEPPPPPAVRPLRRVQPRRRAA